MNNSKTQYNGHLSSLLPRAILIGLLFPLSMSLFMYMVSAFTKSITYTTSAGIGLVLIIVLSLFLYISFIPIFFGYYFSKKRLGYFYALLASVIVTVCAFSVEFIFNLGQSLVTGMRYGTKSIFALSAILGGVVEGFSGQKGNYYFGDTELYNTFFISMVILIITNVILFTVSYWVFRLMKGLDK